MAFTPQWTSFTATPIYNKAALRFPRSGSIGEIEIPLHITKLAAQNEGSQITETMYGPLIDQTSNLGSGGTAVSYNSNQLSKISLEGWVDTPTIQVSTSTFTDGLYPSDILFPSDSLFPGQGSTTITGVYQVPGIIIDGYNVTYGEIIAAYFEGRTNVVEGSPWALAFPKWFRDSYGRVYGDQTPTGRKGLVRIIDLTLQRVEAVPGRNIFTMTLQIG